MATISIKDTLKQKHVLVTGASGFVGKVLTSMMLHRIPEIGKITVLMRAKRGQSGHERFELIIGYSPVFKPLHDSFGADLASYIGPRLEVVEGDVSEPNLGLSDGDLTRLQESVDLVINSAGLVDFNPDVRWAISTNTDGAMNVLEFARGCNKKAGIVHISTCYVAGRGDGLIAEQLNPDYAPAKADFDAETEYAAIQALIESITTEFAQDAVREAISKQVLKKMAETGVDSSNRMLFESLLEKERKRAMRRAMRDRGSEHAQALGWTNTYTFSKSLAESLLIRRAGDVPFAVVRPSIVESAETFPFAGWNEGFNTCGPLAYLIGSWIPTFKGRDDHPLDLIPVDMLCNGLLTVSAAMLRGEHESCYQLATSSRNRLNLRRAAELCSLGHRRYLRNGGAKSQMESRVLPHWETRAVEGDHLLSVSNLRSAVKSAGRFLASLPDERLPEALQKKRAKWVNTAKATARQLKFVQKVTDTFEPFVYYNVQVYDCQAIDCHIVKEREFSYDPERIDWRHYWLNVHLPGLRKWCFPVLEGRPIERHKPVVPFRLPKQPAVAPKRVDVPLRKVEVA